MVKVYFHNCWWGNRKTYNTETFNSIDEFLNYTLDINNFKYSYISYGKDGICHFCKSNEGYSEFKGSDRFEIYLKTYDPTGIYLIMVERIDVDGKCFLNKETDGKDWKYIITNSFIEQIFKPYVDKVQKSKEIDYAD